jgi:hypothetical protein
METTVFEILITGLATPMLVLCTKTALDGHKMRVSAARQERNIDGLIKTLQTEVTNLNAKIDRQIELTNEEIAAAKERSRVVIHDRLSQAHSYYMERGSIDKHSLDALHEMHKVYHEECKGNGYADKLMRDINSLPVTI